METTKCRDSYKCDDHSYTHVFILHIHLFGTYLGVTLLGHKVQIYSDLLHNVKQFLKMVNYTNLHYHDQCMRILVFHQHLVQTVSRLFFPFFLIKKVNIDIL